MAASFQDTLQGGFHPPHGLKKEGRTRPTPCDAPISCHTRLAFAPTFSGVTDRLWPIRTKWCARSAGAPNTSLP